MSNTVCLIAAAGRGERAGQGLPKQYRRIAGQAVLRWTVAAFLGQPKIAAVQVVIAPEDRWLYEEAVAGLALPPPLPGGRTRQESVLKGLEALAAQRFEQVLIHDGARPFPSAALIARVCDALEHADAAAPMVKLADTLRRKAPTGFDIVARDGLWRAQTPQAFRFDKILAAHRRFFAEPATDDFQLAERAGLSFSVVEGEEGNIKITTAEDFELAERLAHSALCDVRTGSGFDVHRFVPGDHIWLCGIRIEHGFALEGHSDADCGLHAVTDALLGALGMGDIGMHFPPTDPRWRGASSDLFVAHAARLVREAGGVIAHIDVTIICERPKIAPHRDAMRARIAAILEIDPARVSVKATTAEGLGFTGRGEGLAAQALATIRLPS